MSLTAIDLFSGAGGLSLGLQQAGFSPVFALERDVAASQTYRSRHPGVSLYVGDVRQYDFRSWRGVDLVAGGPPCQPFSTGGHRRGKNDERDLLPEFVRAVRTIKPRAFLLENVPGLVSPQHAPYLEQVFEPIRDTYHIVGPTLLNAADFGVPQSRRRCFIVGLLRATFAFPVGDRARWVPCGDILGPAPLGPANTSKVVYAKNPDLRPSPYHGQLFNGGGRPMDLKLPAPTILASAGGNKTHFLDLLDEVPRYHRHLMAGGRPRKGVLPGARRLTVAESAALQTFPVGMVFSGSRSQQYTQIGNAVPPTLAFCLGEALRRALKQRERRRKHRLSNQLVLA